MRTSIIVLCYNSLEETTRPCLESIVKNTLTGEYELIVIDNASSDGTPEYLQEFSKGHANVKIQLNDVNKGYAGGNNNGIALANSEYIVLLNNDTLVPAGWLDRLLFLFQNHPNIGLIGPVTNSAGNEQRIELDKLNENNYEAISGEYIKRQSGVWFESEKLGFFCVAIRRSVVEKIGLLDENFGIGMFEDDDYCIRAKKAGFTLAVAEDCYVFHKGSVSFGKMAVENYRQLFDKNRQYFYEKHQQAWLFSDIAMRGWLCLKRDLMTIRNDEVLDNALCRLVVRLTNVENAIYQMRQVESQFTKIGESTLLSIQIAEKHKLLMEMSNWASGLNADNSRMSEELNNIKNSKLYPLLKLAKKYGI
jgi:GT2 family glycosyltransferase